MSNVFLASDHHFGHKNILNFTKKDGSKVRDFSSVEEMNEHIIEKHNSVVGKYDRVYFLGDVVMNKKYMDCLERLNGKIVLIKGNHDIFELKEYVKYFEDIRGSHVFNSDTKEGRIIATHIPIHLDSLDRFYANVHGHLHDGEVMYGDNPDPYYFCVSMERIDYTPISLEEMKKKITERKAR